MPGRKRRHRNCSARYNGRVINAYVRLGSPSKWSVIGEVCVDCGDFTYCGEPPDAESERARDRR